jgi:hypothetical protein
VGVGEAHFACRKRLCTRWQRRKTVFARRNELSVYGIDKNTAFHLLKWRSQQSNVKLRALAE